MSGAHVPSHLKLPVAAPGMCIGLLGGSFNPAHDAHREISLAALSRIGLDRVWWLVTPGNPLKDQSNLPDLRARVAAARNIVKDPRIAVTGFHGGQGTGYTIDLLKALQRRLPDVHFVWLMGADNLIEFHRWRSWADIFGTVPIAVLDRPGFRLKARASPAARRFASSYVGDTNAAALARRPAPAWTILTHRLSGLSSTAIRENVLNSG